MRSPVALYPSTTKRLAPRKAVAFEVPLHLAWLSERPYDDDLTLSIQGDPRYRATVTPSRVHLSRPHGQASAAVRLPAGWSGDLSYTVTATGSAGARARATIDVIASAPLEQQFAASRRVRVYGIHFDTDSAAIQPQSRTTIAEIAALLQAHADWKMRVQGHTDSDGSGEHNRELSDRRAHAIVLELTAHYAIAPSRLVAAGFGASRPVASNATAEGKALNRRVELVRL